MKSYSTIDLGKRKELIAGIEVEFTLTAECYYDEYFELDWDFEPGAKEELERKINRGDLTPTGIVVTATAADCETGEDSLWANLIGSVSDTIDIIEGQGMIETAIDAAVKSTLIRAAQLAKFQGVKS